MHPRFTTPEKPFEPLGQTVDAIILRQGWQLAMTHHCIMENRAAMAPKSSEANTRRFDSDPTLK